MKLNFFVKLIIVLVSVSGGLLGPRRDRSHPIGRESSQEHESNPAITIRSTTMLNPLLAQGDDDPRRSDSCI